MMILKVTIKGTIQQKQQRFYNLLKLLVQSFYSLLIFNEVLEHSFLIYVTYLDLLAMYYLIVNNDVYLFESLALGEKL